MKRVFLWLFIFHFAGIGQRKTLSPRQDRTRGIPALHPTAQRQLRPVESKIIYSRVMCDTFPAYF